MPSKITQTIVQMGFGLAHSSPTTFARSPDDESSNRRVSPFSLINDLDKRHATLGATIYRIDSWSLSPLVEKE
jgi:hypothetical protein